MDRIVGRLEGWFDRARGKTVSDPLEVYIRTPVDWYVGQAITIPVGQNESVVYRVPFEADDGQQRWRLNRGAFDYEEDLFGDEFMRIWSEGAWKLVRRADGSPIVAGGIEAAFAPGRVVLDLGSGLAKALLQFSRDYPRTTFIGVDGAYNNNRRPTIPMPGKAQLIADNWEKLDSIPDHAIDTILSEAGAFRHGVVDLKPEASLGIVKTINRVARGGAILRFALFRDGQFDGDNNKFVRDLLERNGWDVTFVDRSETVVAIRN